MTSRSALLDLPQAAMARDLLRAWYGLTLVVTTQAELGAALAAHEPWRLCAARRAKEVAEAIDALATAIERSRAASAHQTLAGLWVVAAAIPEGRGAIALAALGASPDSATALTELLGIAPAEGKAVIDRLTPLGPADLGRAAELVDRAAAAMARIAGADDSAPAAGQHPFVEMIGSAPAIIEVAKLVEKVAKSHATTLIHGESGTGKELIARAIHFHGPRAKKPFVVQNCSAFNDNLLESALFGHVRGAFTGAVKDQRGLFEAADGGTFFLDEVGDMSSALQVKLLRVLQEGTFTPVGGTKPVKVDVRVVAASHKDLAAMVGRKEFREDLFYRLNVLKISLPPLRDRKSDIPMLVRHFLRKHQPAGRPAPRVLPATMTALLAYAWPGNIRELENEIERMLVLAGNADELGPSLVSPRIAGGGHAAVAVPIPLADLARATMSQAITTGLLRTSGDRDTLARELGVSRAYLEAQCAALGIDEGARS